MVGRLLSMIGVGLDWMLRRGLGGGVFRAELGLEGAALLRGVQRFLLHRERGLVRSRCFP
jgi:hypothetical protein